MRTILFAVCLSLGVSCAAMAQKAEGQDKGLDVSVLKSKGVTVDDLDAAKKALERAAKFESIGAADDTTVSNLNVTIELKNADQDGPRHGVRRRGSSQVVVVNPSDPEFASVLAAVKAVAARRAGE